MSQDETLLYHYTSLESFRGIVQSSTLWASHIRYLNDASEQRLMSDLVLQRIEERLQDTTDSYHKKLLELKAIAASPQDEDIYVISFSEDGGDSLSQWRGYGDNAGVSVGFSLAELRRQCMRFTTRAFKPPHNTGAAIPIKVQYIDPSKREQSNGVIDALLNQVMNNPPVGEFNPEQAFARRVSSFAAKFKHAAFSDEREYRIIIFDLKGGPTPGIRVRKSLLIPYVELDIRDAEPSRIVVGPSPNLENTAAAIRYFSVAMKSSKLEVRETQIPYRDW